MRHLAVLGLLGCSGSSDFVATEIIIPEGAPAPEDEQVQDVLLQTAAAAVDVVWLVESEEDSELPLSIQAAAPLFFDQLIEAEVDFRVGLSVEGSGLLWVDSSSDKPAGLVGDYLLAPVAPETPAPHPLDATNDALKAAVSSREALGRSSVPLHVLVISDLDDPKRTPNVQVEELTTWVSGLLPPEDLSLSGITGPGVAASFDSLRAVIDGSWSEVATADWSAELLEVSAEAAGLQTEFFLSALPERGTLRVSVQTPTDDGTLEVLDLDELDYAYDNQRNTIVLSSAPSAGSSVVVNYVRAGSLGE